METRLVKKALLEAKQDEQLDTLRDTVAYLERELVAQREEIARLRMIEAAAVKAICRTYWSGDERYNDMCALDAALKES